MGTNNDFANDKLSLNSITNSTLTNHNSKDNNSYFTGGHWGQCLELLQHLCQYSDNIILVLGETGIGKTTLQHALLATNNPLVTYCNLNAKFYNDIATLNQDIINNLGIASNEQGNFLANTCLQPANDEQLKILIIDDANLLAIEILTAVIQLFTTATNNPNNPAKFKLILLGTAELEEKIAAIKVQLPPNNLENIHVLELENLSLAEVEFFLLHKWRMAEKTQACPFNSQLSKKIYQLSAGNPKQVEKLANEYLTTGKLTATLNSRTIWFTKVPVITTTITAILVISIIGITPTLVNNWLTKTKNTKIVQLKTAATNKLTLNHDSHSEPQQLPATLNHSSYNASQTTLEPARPNISQATLEPANHNETTQLVTLDHTSHSNSKQLATLAQPKANNSKFSATATTPTITIVNTQELNANSETASLTTPELPANSINLPPQSIIATGQQVTEQTPGAILAEQTTTQAQAEEQAQQIQAKEQAEQTYDLAKQQPNPKQSIALQQKLIITADTKPTMLTPTTNHTNNTATLAIEKPSQTPKRASNKQKNKASTNSTTKTTTAPNNLGKNPVKLLPTSKQHYTLQLLGTSELAGIKTFIVTNNLQKQAYYYQTLRNNKPWYILLYGKYPTKKQAKNAIPNLPNQIRKLNPWPRELATIKNLVKNN